MTKIITPNKDLIIPRKNKKTEKRPLDITIKVVPDTANIGKAKVLMGFNTSVTWLTLEGDQAAELGFKLIQQGTIARITAPGPHYRERRRE